jgi:hypothetical protein
MIAANLLYHNNVKGNHKGGPCVIFEDIFCQEGMCHDCYILRNSALLKTIMR